MTLADRLVLTIPEAAEALGISARQVYVLIDRGDIPSVHIGRLRRIAVRALEQYIEDRQAEEAACISSPFPPGRN